MDSRYSIKLDKRAAAFVQEEAPREEVDMREAIGRTFLTRLLQTAGLSLALISTGPVGVRADTVIGADGAPGAGCDLSEPYCLGGNGGDGESVTAHGNPAVAYGGNGGNGGLGTYAGYYDPIYFGFGGEGGSATAIAEESAARGDVIASATAVGGAGGWYYSGDIFGGNASASATATSDDVSIYATAFAMGIENIGVAYGALQAYAYASAEANGTGGYVLCSSWNLI